MPEALARSRREPMLSAPAPDIAPRKLDRAAARKPNALRILPKTAGGYIAILFAATLLGVMVNAIVLQHERHPAPLFAHEPVAVAPSPVATAPAVASAAPSVETAANPPTPVARPSDLPVASISPKKADPINDLLRGRGSFDSVKDIYAAQRAFAKLGYDLQPNGVMGTETLRALHDFEKSHGLPISSEITPRLLAKLNAATH